MTDMGTKGKFIVFEGTDGSGKSTQIKLLSRYLESKGIRTALTREPTDSLFGALIRSCLSGRMETDEYTIAALFAADRNDHLRNETNGILKKLSEGVSVLCDRFYLSSLAYNGGFVPLAWVKQLNTPAMEAIRPDLTVYIDLDPEEAMSRVGQRGESERYETLERQQKIRKNYFDLFETFGERDNIKVVASASSKDETQQTIRAFADELYGF